MNTKILSTLEFQKITEQLEDLAITDAGKNYAKKLTPQVDFSEVQEAIAQTQDLVDVNRIFGKLPIVEYADLTNIKKRLEINADLNAEELANVLLVLTITNDVKAFLVDQEQLDLTAIKVILSKLQVPEELFKKIKMSVDLDGNILSTASSELAHIRRNYQQLESSIKKTMDQYLHGSSSKYLSEQIITIRDERYVIPVRQEYRQKFGGIVHDQSASGQTLFIEPQAVIDSNNKLTSLIAEEKQEILRILAELSALVHEQIDVIFAAHQSLAQLDFLQSKAMLAKEMKATKPLVNDQNQIDLKKARHPLIDPDKVVANDINLGIDFDMLLITGPNTGGKTITIKTIGLLQLMAQAGLFIPADENSQVSVFNEIFADIGDEQSIEQNLSTFSSHMENVIEILKIADNHSLVLFDELGSGTDPEEGAALAIAILDEVQKQGSLVAATTHYPELKLYAYNRDRVINASMEFDVKNLAPTYNLMLGVPGFSNAFLITKRLGMQDSVVEQAKSLINTENSDLNVMIQNLTTQTKQVTKLHQDLDHELKAAKNTADKLSYELDYFSQQEEEQINRGKLKADEIIATAQKRADRIIKDLTEAKKRGAVSVKENELIEAKGELNKLRDDNLKNNRVLKKARRKNALKVGDEVKVLNYGQFGQITKKIAEDEYEIQMGIMKVRANSQELEKTDSPKPTQTKTRQVSHTSPLWRQSSSSSLDLRGQRYDEAMANLDRYIDSSLLAGLENVTIIHGIGTGAIRKGVNDYLKRNRAVKNFGYAPEGNGGSGATIVEFKWWAINLRKT